MVVIEYSASWPAWLSPSQGGDMAVVAQHYESHPGSLLTQVATRTTRLEAVGWSLDTIILVANGRMDSEANAARSVLARGLFSRLRARGRGELVLTQDEKWGRRAAAGLFSLGEALERSIRGATLGVSVRVGERSWEAALPVADEEICELTRVG